MYKVNVKHGIAKTTDGIRIAYQVSGEGPALICCHAMACDHRMYDQHRDVFSQTHTLITFDQRGSGNSDHPAFIEGPDCLYTIETFGEDLKAVLDQLDIERVSILGFSMGAVSALSFSTLYPHRVERLILASAMASRLPQKIIDRARLVEKVLDTKGINATYDFYYSGVLFEGLLERKEFKELVTLACSRATPHGFKGCFRVTIDRKSLVDKLQFIQCPTLILVGENDTHYLAESELLERTIDTTKRVVMPGVGHSMIAQNPKGFEAALMEFLV